MYEYVSQFTKYQILEVISIISIAFSVAGPTKWNRLPKHIRLAPTIEYFKSKLKTYLFDIAFKLVD